MSRKKIIFWITVILLISSVFLVGCKRKLGGTQRITLTYYKLFDDEDSVRHTIQAYQERNPNVTIRYRKFTDPEAYEDLILNELAEGEGPDIFEVSNLSLPRFFKKIKPLASKSYTPQIFRDNYVSVVTEDFIKQDPADGQEKMYGIPLSVETPVLYYNKEIYEAKLPEKGKPGPLWDDVVDDALVLREESLEGGSKPQLLRGGFAFGRGDNIALAPEILLNLILQEGASFYNSNFTKANLASREAERAFDFYTSFSDPKKKQFSWDETVVSPESSLKEVEAFLTGKVVAITGYADLLPFFEVHSKNLRAKKLSTISEGDIGIVPLPQKSDVLEEKVVLARYRAQTVSRTSKNSRAAWDFIAFLTSKDQAKRYLEKTGKPAARRDLIETQKNDAKLSAFVSQIGFAKTIPMLSETKYREWLTEAIQKAVTGEGSSGSGLRQVQENINELLGDKPLFAEYIPKKASRR